MSSEAMLEDLAKPKRMLTEQLEAINRQKGNSASKGLNSGLLSLLKLTSAFKTHRTRLLAR